MVCTTATRHVFFCLDCSHERQTSTLFRYCRWQGFATLVTAVGEGDYLVHLPHVADVLPSLRPCRVNVAPGGLGQECGANVVDTTLNDTFVDGTQLFSIDVREGNGTASARVTATALVWHVPAETQAVEAAASVTVMAAATGLDSSWQQLPDPVVVALRTRTELSIQAACTRATPQAALVSAVFVSPGFAMGLLQATPVDGNATISSCASNRAHAMLFTPDDSHAGWVLPLCVIPVLFRNLSSPGNGTGMLPLLRPPGEVLQYAWSRARCILVAVEALSPVAPVAVGAAALADIRQAAEFAQGLRGWSPQLSEAYRMSQSATLISSGASVLNASASVGLARWGVMGPADFARRTECVANAGSPLPPSIGRIRPASSAVWAGVASGSTSVGLLALAQPVFTTGDWAVFANLSLLRPATAHAQAFGFVAFTLLQTDATWDANIATVTAAATASLRLAAARSRSRDRTSRGGLPATLAATALPGNGSGVIVVMSLGLPQELILIVQCLPGSCTLLRYNVTAAVSLGRSTPSAATVTGDLRTGAVNALYVVGAPADGLSQGETPLSAALQESAMLPLLQGAKTLRAAAISGVINLCDGSAFSICASPMARWLSDADYAASLPLNDILCGSTSGDGLAALSMPATLVHTLLFQTSSDAAFVTQGLQLQWHDRWAVRTTAAEWATATSADNELQQGGSAVDVSLPFSVHLRCRALQTCDDPSASTWAECCGLNFDAAAWVALMLATEPSVHLAVSPELPGVTMPDGARVPFSLQHPVALLGRVAVAEVAGVLVRSVTTEALRGAIEVPLSQAALRAPTVEFPLWLAGRYVGSVQTAQGLLTVEAVSGDSEPVVTLMAGTLSSGMRCVNATFCSGALWNYFSRADGEATTTINEYSPLRLGAGTDLHLVAVPMQGWNVVAAAMHVSLPRSPQSLASMSMLDSTRNERTVSVTAALVYGNTSHSWWRARPLVSPMIAPLAAANNRSSTLPLDALARMLLLLVWPAPRAADASIGESAWIELVVDGYPVSTVPVEIAPGSVDWSVSTVRPCNGTRLLTNATLDAELIVCPAGEPARGNLLAEPASGGAPDDPTGSPFMELTAGILALLEIRPRDKWGNDVHIPADAFSDSVWVTAHHVATGSAGNLSCWPAFASQRFQWVLLCNFSSEAAGDVIVRLSSTTSAVALTPALLVRVYCAEVSAAASIVLIDDDSPLTHVVAGSNTTLFLRARDRFSNRVCPTASLLSESALLSSLQHLALVPHDWDGVSQQWQASVSATNCTQAVSYLFPVADSRFTPLCGTVQITFVVPCAGWWSVRFRNGSAMPTEVHPSRNATTATWLQTSRMRYNASSHLLDWYPQVYVAAAPPCLARSSLTTDANGLILVVGQRQRAGLLQLRDAFGNPAPLKTQATAANVLGASFVLSASLFPIGNRSAPGHDFVGAAATTCEGTESTPLELAMGLVSFACECALATMTAAAQARFVVVPSAELLGYAEIWVMATLPSSDGVLELAVANAGSALGGSSFALAIEHLSIVAGEPSSAHSNAAINIPLLLADAESRDFAWNATLFSACVTLRDKWRNARLGGGDTVAFIAWNRTGLNETAGPSADTFDLQWVPAEDAYCGRPLLRASLNAPGGAVWCWQLQVRFGSVGLTQDLWSAPLNVCANPTSLIGSTGVSYSAVGAAYAGSPVHILLDGAAETRALLVLPYPSTDAEQAPRPVTAFVRRAAILSQEGAFQPTLRSTLDDAQEGSSTTAVLVTASALADVAVSELSVARALTLHARGTFATLLPLHEPFHSHAVVFGCTAISSAAPFAGQDACLPGELLVLLVFIEGELVTEYSTAAAVGGTLTPTDMALEAGGVSLGKLFTGFLALNNTIVAAAEPLVDASAHVQWPATTAAGASLLPNASDFFASRANVTAILVCPLVMPRVDDLSDPLLTPWSFTCNASGTAFVAILQRAEVADVSAELLLFDGSALQAVVATRTHSSASFRRISASAPESIMWRTSVQPSNDPFLFAGHFSLASADDDTALVILTLRDGFENPVTLSDVDVFVHVGPCNNTWGAELSFAGSDAVTHGWVAHTAVLSTIYAVQCLHLEYESAAGQRTRALSAPLPVRGLPPSSAMSYRVAVRLVQATGIEQAAVARNVVPLYPCTVGHAGVLTARLQIVAAVGASEWLLSSSDLLAAELYVSVTLSREGGTSSAVCAVASISPAPLFCAGGVACETRGGFYNSTATVMCERSGNWSFPARMEARLHSQSTGKLIASDIQLVSAMDAVGSPTSVARAVYVHPPVQWWLSSGSPVEGWRVWYNNSTPDDGAVGYVSLHLADSDVFVLSVDVSASLSGACSDITAADVCVIPADDPMQATDAVCAHALPSNSSWLTDGVVRFNITAAIQPGRAYISEARFFLAAICSSSPSQQTLLGGILRGSNSGPEESCPSVVSLKFDACSGIAATGVAAMRSDTLAGEHLPTLDMPASPWALQYYPTSTDAASDISTPMPLVVALPQGCGAQQAFAPTTLLVAYAAGADGAAEQQQQARCWVSNTTISCGAAGCTALLLLHRTALLAAGAWSGMLRIGVAVSASSPALHAQAFAAGGRSIDELCAQVQDGAVAGSTPIVTGASGVGSYRLLPGNVTTVFAYDGAADGTSSSLITQPAAASPWAYPQDLDSVVTVAEVASPVWTLPGSMSAVLRDVRPVAIGAELHAAFGVAGTGDNHLVGSAASGRMVWGYALTCDTSATSTYPGCTDAVYSQYAPQDALAWAWKATTEAEYTGTTLSTLPFSAAAQAMILPNTVSPTDGVGLPNAFLLAYPSAEVWADQTSDPVVALLAGSAPSVQQRAMTARSLVVTAFSATTLVLCSTACQVSILVLDALGQTYGGDAAGTDWGAAWLPVIGRPLVSAVLVAPSDQRTTVTFSGSSVAGGCFTFYEPSLAGSLAYNRILLRHATQGMLEYSTALSGVSLPDLKVSDALQDSSNEAALTVTLLGPLTTGVYRNAQDYCIFTWAIGCAGENVAPGPGTFCAVVDNVAANGLQFKTTGSSNTQSVYARAYLCLASSVYSTLSDGTHTLYVYRIPNAPAAGSPTQCATISGKRLVRTLTFKISTTLTAGATASTISGSGACGATALKVGVPASVTLQMRTTGGLSLNVSAGAASMLTLQFGAGNIVTPTPTDFARRVSALSITDNANGTYTFSYVPRLTGTHSLYMYYSGVLWAGTGSTCTVTVGQGDFSSAKSGVRGAYVAPDDDPGSVQDTGEESTMAVVAGHVGFLTVTFRDAFGSTIAVGGLTMTVYFDGPSPLLGPSDALSRSVPAASCAAWESGGELNPLQTRNIAYNCSTAGYYNVTVEVRGIATLASGRANLTGFELMVIPSRPASAVLSGSSVLMAGTCMDVHARLRDVYGNFLVDDLTPRYILKAQPYLTALWLPANSATELEAAAAVAPTNLTAVSAVGGIVATRGQPAPAVGALQWQGHIGGGVVRLRACAFAPTDTSAHTTFKPNGRYWFRPLLGIQAGAGSGQLSDLGPVDSARAFLVRIVAGPPAGRASFFNETDLAIPRVVSAAAGPAPIRLHLRDRLGLDCANATAAARALSLITAPGMPYAAAAAAVAASGGDPSFIARGMSVHSASGAAFSLAFSVPTSTEAAASDSANPCYLNVSLDPAAWTLAGPHTMYVAVAGALVERDALPRITLAAAAPEPLSTGFSVVAAGEPLTAADGDSAANSLVVRVRDQYGNPTFLNATAQLRVWLIPYMLQQASAAVPAPARQNVSLESAEAGSYRIFLTSQFAGLYTLDVHVLGTNVSHLAAQSMPNGLVRVGAADPSVHTSRCSFYRQLDGDVAISATATPPSVARAGDSLQIACYTMDRFGNAYDQSSAVWLTSNNLSFALMRRNDTQAAVQPFAIGELVDGSTIAACNATILRLVDCVVDPASPGTTLCRSPPELFRWAGFVHWWLGLAGVSGGFFVFGTGELPVPQGASSQLAALATWVLPAAPIGRSVSLTLLSSGEGSAAYFDGTVSAPVDISVATAAILLAGVPAFFALTAVDAFGNEVWPAAGGAWADAAAALNATAVPEFQCELFAFADHGANNVTFRRLLTAVNSSTLGTVPSHAQAVRLSPSGLLFTAIATVPGNYSVQTRCPGAVGVIVSTIGRVSVATPPCDLAKTLVSGPGLLVAEAGQWASINITLRDAFGRAFDASGGNCLLYSNASGPVSALAPDTLLAGMQVRGPGVADLCIKDAHELVASEGCDLQSAAAAVWTLQTSPTEFVFRYNISAIHYPAVADSPFLWDASTTFVVAVVNVTVPCLLCQLTTALIAGPPQPCSWALEGLSPLDGAWTASPGFRACEVSDGWSSAMHIVPVLAVQQRRNSLFRLLPRDAYGNAVLRHRPRVDASWQVASFGPEHADCAPAASVWRRNVTLLPTDLFVAALLLPPWGVTAPACTNMSVTLLSAALHTNLTFVFLGEVLQQPLSLLPLEGASAPLECSAGAVCTTASAPADSTLLDVLRQSSSFWLERECVSPVVPDHQMMTCIQPATADFGFGGGGIKLSWTALKSGIYTLKSAIGSSLLLPVLPVMDVVVRPGDARLNATMAVLSTDGYNASIAGGADVPAGARVSMTVTQRDDNDNMAVLNINITNIASMRASLEVLEVDGGAVPSSGFQVPASLAGSFCNSAGTCAAVSGLAALPPLLRGPHQLRVILASGLGVDAVPQWGTCAEAAAGWNGSYEWPWQQLWAIAPAAVAAVGLQTVSPTEGSTRVCATDAGVVAASDVGETWLAADYAGGPLGFGDLPATTCWVNDTSSPELRPCLLLQPALSLWEAAVGPFVIRVRGGQPPHSADESTRFVVHVSWGSSDTAASLTGIVVIHASTASPCAVAASPIFLKEDAAHVRTFTVTTSAVDAFGGFVRDAAGGSPDGILVLPLEVAAAHDANSTRITFDATGDFANVSVGTYGQYVVIRVWREAGIAPALPGRIVALAPPQGFGGLEAAELVTTASPAVLSASGGFSSQQLVLTVPTTILATLLLSDLRPAVRIAADRCTVADALGSTEILRRTFANFATSLLADVRFPGIQLAGEYCLAVCTPGDGACTFETFTVIPEWSSMQLQNDDRAVLSKWPLCATGVLPTSYAASVCQPSWRLADQWQNAVIPSPSSLLRVGWLSDRSDNTAHGQTLPWFPVVGGAGIVLVPQAEGFGTGALGPTAAVPLVGSAALPVHICRMELQGDSWLWITAAVSSSLSDQPVAHELTATSEGIFLPRFAFCTPSGQPFAATSPVAAAAVAAEALASGVSAIFIASAAVTASQVLQVLAIPTLLSVQNISNSRWEPRLDLAAALNNDTHCIAISTLSGATGAGFCVLAGPPSPDRSDVTASTTLTFRWDASAARFLADTRTFASNLASSVVPSQLQHLHVSPAADCPVFAPTSDLGVGERACSSSPAVAGVRQTSLWASTRNLLGAIYNQTTFGESPADRLHNDLLAGWVSASTWLASPQGPIHRRCPLHTPVFCAQHGVCMVTPSACMQTSAGCPDAAPLLCPGAAFASLSGTPEASSAALLYDGRPECAVAIDECPQPAFSVSESTVTVTGEAFQESLLPAVPVDGVAVTGTAGASGAGLQFQAGESCEVGYLLCPDVRAPSLNMAPLLPVEPVCLPPWSWPQLCPTPVSCGKGRQMCWDGQCSPGSAAQQSVAAAAAAITAVSPATGRIEASDTNGGPFVDDWDYSCFSSLAAQIIRGNPWSTLAAYGIQADVGSVAPVSCQSSQPTRCEDLLCAVDEESCIGGLVGRFSAASAAAVLHATSDLAGLNATTQLALSSVLESLQAQIQNVTACPIDSGMIPLADGSCLVLTEASLLNDSMALLDRRLLLGGLVAAGCHPHAPLLCPGATGCAAAVEDCPEMPACPIDTPVWCPRLGSCVAARRVCVVQLWELEQQSRFELPTVLASPPSTPLVAAIARCTSANQTFCAARGMCLEPTAFGVGHCAPVEVDMTNAASSPLGELQCPHAAPYLCASGECVRSPMLPSFGITPFNASDTSTSGNPFTCTPTAPCPLQHPVLCLGATGSGAGAIIANATGLTARSVCSATAESCFGQLGGGAAFFPNGTWQAAPVDQVATISCPPARSARCALNGTNVCTAQSLQRGSGSPQATCKQLSHYGRMAAVMDGGAPEAVASQATSVIHVLAKPCPRPNQARCPSGRCMAAMAPIGTFDLGDSPSTELDLSVLNTLAASCSEGCPPGFLMCTYGRQYASLLWQQRSAVSRQRSAAGASKYAFAGPPSTVGLSLWETGPSPACIPVALVQRTCLSPPPFRPVSTEAAYASFALQTELVSLSPQGSPPLTIEGQGFSATISSTLAATVRLEDVSFTQPENLTEAVVPSARSVLATVLGALPASQSPTAADDSGVLSIAIDLPTAQEVAILGASTTPVNASAVCMLVCVSAYPATTSASCECILPSTQLGASTGNAVPPVVPTAYLRRRLQDATSGSLTILSALAASVNVSITAAATPSRFVGALVASIDVAALAGSVGVVSAAPTDLQIIVTAMDVVAALPSASPTPSPSVSTSPTATPSASTTATGSPSSSEVRSPYATRKYMLDTAPTVRLPIMTLSSDMSQYFRVALCIAVRSRQRRAPASAPP